MTSVISTSAQYNLSQIMSDAWNLVRQTGKTISDALKTVWAKAQAAVRKLNIDVAKLAELSVAELKDLAAAIQATITEKEAEQEKPKSMSHAIKMAITDTQVRTTSYYNSCFVEKARNLRGSWTNGQWVFPISVLEHVKNAMLECYGVTGEQPYEVCTLTVKEWSNHVRCGGIELFGRPIAKAFGRDSGAKLQEGIIWLSGSYDSTGSVKNWYTSIENGTFEIHEFPVACLSWKKVQSKIEEGQVVVK